MSLRIRARLTVLAASTATTLAVVFVTALPVSAAISAQFNWAAHSWCPNVRGTNGWPASCTAVQPGFHTGDGQFDPAQVSIDGSGYMRLTANSTATSTGAFNTGGQETFSASSSGNAISERISLPCSGSPAKVDNWPAFWLVTPGQWPLLGEIDIAEGLHGQISYAYHYQDKSGVKRQLLEPYPNTTGCGTHTYKIVWRSGTNPRIIFYADGSRVGTFAGSCSGITAPCYATIDGTPVATGPMYLINNYETEPSASPAYGGPVVGNATMKVLSMTGTHN